MFGERADIEIATQPPGFWERDPDEVMADISRVIRGEPIVAESSAPGDGESDDTRQPQDLAVDPEKRQISDTRLNFLSDAHNPAVDYLNRARLAFVLAGRLNQIWDTMNRTAVSETGGVIGPIRPGFVVHIDAPWGGGKSAFAGFLTRILNPYRHAGPLPEWMESLPLDDGNVWPEACRRPWHVVSFNAWRHQHVKPPWWVFYDAIRRQCRDAMVHETNRQANTLPEPTDRFAYRCWAARRLWSISDWIVEFGWRLWTPEFRTRFWLAVAMLAIIFSLFLVDVLRVGDNGIELALGATEQDQDQHGVSSLWLTPLIVLLGIAPAMWTASSAFTRTLFPGTPRAARNYSLGSGDPLERFRLHFAKTTERFKRPIVIVVDDLDRCDPSYVVELIRGMQTILVSPRVIFVLLGDRDWIEQAFAETHKAMEGIEVGAEHEFGGRFVEKAIQFSFVLPDVSEPARHSYVRDLLELEDFEDQSKIERDNAPRPGRDTVERLKEKTEAVLGMKAYAEREAAAAVVRESPTLQGLGEDQTNAMLQEFNVKLSLRAATDSTAQRATRHMIEALAPTLPPNPRQIKRIVNTISLMQEVARLEGVTSPGTADWQVMARWIVLMIEWPKTWYTLSRYPGLADKTLGLKEPGALPDDCEALVALLKSNEAVMNLLTFSDDERGWQRRDITGTEILWLRKLMPATSGRMLVAGRA